jgi:hypothetical protein
MVRHVTEGNYHPIPLALMGRHVIYSFSKRMDN